jgi:hypothetical protein
MLLDFSTNPVCRNQKLQQKPKKYELMWSSHEEHHKIVQAAWNHAGGSLASKLAFTLDHMSYWGKQQFGNIPKKIKAAQDDLVELNNNSEKAAMMNKILQKEMETKTLNFSIKKPPNVGSATELIVSWTNRGLLTLMMNTLRKLLLIILRSYSLARTLALIWLWR